MYVLSDELRRGFGWVGKRAAINSRGGDEDELRLRLQQRAVLGPLLRSRISCEHARTFQPAPSLGGGGAGYEQTPVSEGGREEDGLLTRHVGEWARVGDVGMLGCARAAERRTARACEGLRVPDAVDKVEHVAEDAGGGCESAQLGRVGRGGGTEAWNGVPGMVIGPLLAMLNAILSIKFNVVEAVGVGMPNFQRAANLDDGLVVFFPHLEHDE